MENDGSLCGTGALRVNIDFLQGQEAFKATLGPRLPPELLGLIYEIGNMLEERSELFKKHVPLNVSQVSARWRNYRVAHPFSLERYLHPKQPDNRH